MGSLMTIFNEQHNSLAAATRVLQAIAWRQHLTCCKGLWPDDFKGLEELLDVTFSYQTRPETPVPCQPHAPARHCLGPAEVLAPAAGVCTWCGVL